MLYFNLKPVLKARGINNPNQFLIKLGIAKHTAFKMLNDNHYVFRLNHIELICKALHCQPNDLLTYKPNPNDNLESNHPLNKLNREAYNIDWQQSIKTIPLDQLNQIAQIINNNLQNNNP
jgi:DNA-binding Xre family transcriptional regulator